jgi:hypothetical protein
MSGFFRKKEVKESAKENNLNIDTSLLQVTSPSLVSATLASSPRCPIDSCRRFKGKDGEICRCLLNKYYYTLPQQLQEAVSNAGKEKEFVFIPKQELVLPVLRDDKNQDIQEGDFIDILSVSYHFKGEGKVRRTGKDVSFDLSIFLPHDNSSRYEQELHENVKHLVRMLKISGEKRSQLRFPILGKATQDYIASQPDEMNVNTGDYIVVNQIQDDMWGYAINMTKVERLGAALKQVPLTLLADVETLKVETFFMNTLSLQLKSALYQAHLNKPLGYASLSGYEEDALCHKSKLPNDVEKQTLEGGADYIFCTITGVFSSGKANVAYKTNTGNFRVHQVNIADLRIYSHDF